MVRLGEGVPRCMYCGKTGQEICNACLERMEAHEDSVKRTKKRNRFLLIILAVAVVATVLKIYFLGI
jgi:hypothetical protein